MGYRNPLCVLDKDVRRALKKHGWTFTKFTSNSHLIFTSRSGKTLMVGKHAQVKKLVLRDIERNK